MYKDSDWWPALAAVTGSETTEDALDELARFKAAENRISKEVDRQADEIEAELMDAVAELKTRRPIFGPLPSVEELVNPPGELEAGETLDQFKSDAEMIEAVCKGVEEEEDVDDEIEECPPPQMRLLEMAKLSKSLRSVCIGAEVEVGYELTKMLRRFEVQIRTVEPQKSTQQRLDGWLDVGSATQPR